MIMMGEAETAAVALILTFQHIMSNLELSTSTVTTTCSVDAITHFIVITIE